MSSAVILLNWNGWKDTLACVESLLAADNPKSFKIIVCDNGSKDNSLSLMQQWCETQLPGAWIQLDKAEVEAGGADIAQQRVVLVDNQANLGFAGGCNVGIKLAMQDPACRYVWLLNNDTEIAPDALEKAQAYMDAHPDVGICGSTLIYYHDRHMVQAYGGSHYSPWLGRSRHLGAFSNADQLPSAADVPAIEAQTTYVVGAAMLLRRELLEKIGLLYEGYFLYYEELDIAVRARKYCRLGYAHDSIVFHKEGASIGTHASGGSPLSLYYLFRNRLRFTWRYFPLCLPTVLLFALWELTKLLLKRRWPQAWATARGILNLKAPVPGK